MPNQVVPAMNRRCISVSDDKQIVRDTGDGVVIVVGHDDAVVPAPFPDKMLDGADADRVDLCKRLVQDIEPGFTEKHHVQFCQTGLSAGELPNVGIMEAGVLRKTVDK